MQALVGPGKTAANLAKFDSLVGDTRRQKTADYMEPCIGLREIGRCFDFNLWGRLELELLIVLTRIGERFQKGGRVQVCSYGQPGLGCISLPLARGLKDAACIFDLDNRHTKPAACVFALDFKLRKRHFLPIEYRAGDRKFRDFQGLEVSSIDFEDALNERLPVGKRCL